MGVCRICLLAVISVESLAQVTILTQPQDATVVEGGDATFVCAGLENGMAVQFIWDFIRVGGHRKAVSTGSNLTGISMVTVNGDLTQLTLSGVQREVEGAMVLCSAIGSTGNVDSNPATVTVYYPPVYNFLPNQPTTVLEGDDFTFSLGFDASPIPTNFTWSRDGQVISSGGRIATTVSTITITSTTRSDSGSYNIVSFNVVGSGKGFFTLDVQFPPLIINRASQTILAQGGDFIFNCTSGPANPLAVNYTIQKDRQAVDGGRATVQGPVLTITSVQAGDGGNYSCSASNSVGSDTVYNSLIVPPSAPANVFGSNISPFSATVSWQPPLENGGAVGPLTYTVTLTNTSDSTTLKFNPNIALTMNITNLRHSVTYQLQVVAGNVAGVGQAAELVFRTNDTVPTVGGVEALVLTLDTVQVDITVSDDGGQPVLEYTVIVENREQRFSAGPVVQVSGLSLAAGVNYGIGVVARNSIGESKTFVGSFSVPAFSSAPSYQDLKAMVIAFGVVLFILLLLLVLAIVAAALLYASKRKVKLARAPSMYDIGHTSTVQYDEVQPHDLPQPSQTQPPNLLPVEEGGMSRSISNNVLEENPAYQAANAQTTTLTDGPLYL